MRRIPLSRRSHVTGFQPLTTGSTEFESALERDFVTLASFLAPTASITAQPVTLRFPDGQKVRRYTPDFLIRSDTRSGELIEVKYAADLASNAHRLEPGFAAARAWACGQGITFRVVTEREIRTPLLENAKRLRPLRDSPMDEVLAAQFLAAAALRPPATFGGLLDAFASDRPKALTTLWRLIARGALRTDLAAAITFGSEISVP